MTPSTNSTSNSSGWIAMSTKLTPALLFLFLLSGCGIFTGNPESDLSGPSGDFSPSDAFSDLRAEYQMAQANQTENQTDCGLFTETSTSTEVEVGRDCIRSAFSECLEAFYLLDETLSTERRFASFVVIDASCQVTVHAVSTDTDRFTGEKTETCTTLETSEPIELACGIAD